MTSSWPALPELGAIPSRRGTAFRVWAPAAGGVELEIEGQGTPVAMEKGTDGYATALVADAGPGTRYRYRLNGDGPFPDPCSRSQPEGPHGPSEVVSPAAFTWTDDRWTGLTGEGLVIYELHIGTFTPEGTFDSAVAELPRLRDLGITAIEIMPVAEFPGSRNWGYDGVDLFAPSHVYGGPDGLRRLVNAAHAIGLGVILDVVYNHVGPDGNYLRAYAPAYFTDRHSTPWGEAVNVDGPDSRPVRDFFCANAVHWVREYHIDGLRLDAVHAIIDESPVHILEELTARVREAAAPRPVVVIAEDHGNDVRLFRSPTASPPGLGLDGVWADDFHHAVRVHLTGERDGYYAAYEGTPAEIATTINEGFLFQGQVSPHTGEPRGTRVTDEPASGFVFCIQNHDQVGNRAEGERLTAPVSMGQYLAASALLLLSPETPLLFMGQEYAAATPFLYFTDHNEELGRLVTEGRRNEFAGFAAFQDPARRERIPDPQAESTFIRSKLDPAERRRNAETERHYRALLHLRRDDPVLRVQDRAATRAFPLGAGGVTLHRWHGGEHRLAVLALSGPVTVSWADTGTAPNAPSVLWQSGAGSVTHSGVELAEAGAVLIGWQDGARAEV